MAYVLIGFMGAGKSAVGKRLAKSLGYRFLDMDHEIEARIGTSIRAFFEQQGEQAFRDLEQQVVGETAQRADDARERERYRRNDFYPHT